MILLDFLFNIWYSPFRNAQKGGRILPVIFLAYSLTFLFLGFLILLTYFLFDFRLFSFISPLLASFLSILTYILFYFILNLIYNKKNREISRIRYPIVYGLLIPFLLLGPMFLFIYSLDKFG